MTPEQMLFLAMQRRISPFIGYAGGGGLGPWNIGSDPTDPTGGQGPLPKGGTGDIGHGPDSGTHRAPQYHGGRVPWVGSSATDELRAGGFSSVEGNPLIRRARRGTLELTDQGYRFGPHGDIRSYVDEAGLHSFIPSGGVTPELISQRGMAVHQALQELEDRFNAKRAARKQRRKG